MIVVSNMLNHFEIGQKLRPLEQNKCVLCTGGIIRCYLNANCIDKLSFEVKILSLVGQVTPQEMILG